MAVQINGETITIGGQTFQIGDFPLLLERHLNTVCGTLDLERQAEELRATGFASHKDVEQFVREVCRWGGYAGIAGRIINQNTLAEICAVFRTACAYLNAEPPTVYWAMRSINDLKQLQRISFASKHLRFLRPDLCPVLDSLLSDWLNYPINWGGYVGFALDCQEVARTLDAHQIPLPEFRSGTAWFVADVEMALFSRKRGW